MKMLLAILSIPVVIVACFIGFARVRNPKHTHCGRCEAAFDKPQRFAFCSRCWAVMR